MRSLIEAVLDEYEVISTTKIAEGLQQIAERKFHLYVLDNHLPDGTGLEFVGLIRSFDVESPILIVSGEGSITEAQAIENGANGVIVKSGHDFVDKLSRKVEELLR